MALMQVIFQSSLVRAHETSLAQIFAAGRRNNKKNDITGMLLCSGRDCLSVLEGDSAKVMETFERICADRRHTVTDSWSDTHLRQRQYNKWLSGYPRLGHGPLQQEALTDTFFFDDFDLSNVHKLSGFFQEKVSDFQHSTQEFAASEFAPGSLGAGPFGWTTRRG